MEILLFLAVGLAVLIIPQTQTESDAIENRRLRKQRQRGNFNATARTSPAKASKMSFKTLRNEWTYSKKVQLIQEIHHFIYDGHDIDLNEEHVTYNKELVSEIKDTIKSLDSDNDSGLRLYSEFLEKYEAEGIKIKNRVNNIKNN